MGKVTEIVFECRHLTPIKMSIHARDLEPRNTQSPSSFCLLFCHRWFFCLRVGQSKAKSLLKWFWAARTAVRHKQNKWLRESDTERERERMRKRVRSAGKSSLYEGKGRRTPLSLPPSLSFTLSVAGNTRAQRGVYVLRWRRGHFVKYVLKTHAKPPPLLVLLLLLLLLLLFRLYSCAKQRESKMRNSLTHVKESDGG